jgi:hypothetical protein
MRFSPSNDLKIEKTPRMKQLKRATLFVHFRGHPLHLSNRREMQVAKNIFLEVLALPVTETTILL